MLFINEMNNLILYFQGVGRPTAELETKENFVQMQTVGIVYPPQTHPIKVDYTSMFGDRVFQCSRNLYSQLLSTKERLT